MNPPESAVILMTRIKLCVFLLAALLPCAGQSADQVVEKCLEARGGREKLKSVQTERLAGNISFGTNPPGPFVVEFKRPHKMRMAIATPDGTLIRVYDGQSGWLKLPGGEEARAMSPGEVTNISRGADFDGPFLGAAAKGNKIELAGRLAVEGKDTFKLKVTMNDGTVDYYYIDARTYLPVMWEGERTANGSSVVYVSWFREYKKVDGITFPWVIESATKGGKPGDGQRITTDKIELNVPEDDGRFVKP